MTKNKNITITWKAFGDRPSSNKFITSVSFVTDFSYKADDLEICEMIFADTNTYSGKIWNIIEPSLSSNRTHTALSINDEITINDVTYRCAMIGFEKI